VTLTISRLIRSTLTRHTARSVPGGWAVTWLPARTLTQPQAVTAMNLAELTGLDNPDPIGYSGDPRWGQADTWAAELGMSGPAAVARSSESPEDVAARAAEEAGQ
jgi:hypothetical protein